MDAPLDYANVNPRSDRRAHVRRRISLLAYADLGMENGGIVLDLSEGGMAVQAVAALAAEPLPRIRFQLPETPGWIETSGRVAWLSESKRDGGIEFTALSQSAREKIHAWISSSGAAEDLRRERRTAARAAAGKAGASPETAAASANGEHAPAEPPKEAALDLMISTAEFSTTEGMEGRQPFAVPASSMVAPVPPFPEQRPLEERFTGPGLAGQGVAGEGLAGEGFPAPGPGANRPAPIPPVVPPMVPAATAPAPARLPLRQPPPSGPRPVPGSLFDRENGPDLRLFGHAAAEHELARPRRSRLGIAAVVIVLALASFVAGMKAAQGSFDPAFSTIKSRVGGLWSAVSQAASGNSTTAPAANASSQNDQTDSNAPNNQASPAGNPSPAVNPPAASAKPAQAPPATATAPPTSATNAISGDANSSTTGATAPPPSTGLAAAGGTASDPAAGGFTTPDGITIRSQQLVAIPTDSDSSSQNQALQIGGLTHRVDPVYPADAKQQWIEGTVKVRAAVAPDGSVVTADVVSGDSRLAAAAEEAVRGWRYDPTLINGKPVATEEQITFVFRLPRTGEPTR